MLTAAVAALVLSTATPAWADGGFSNQGSKESSSADGSAGNGSVGAGATTTVEVTTGGSTTEGTPFSSVKRVPVPRRCWYDAGRTGPEYYAIWGPGGSAYTSPSANPHIEPTLHDGYEQYENETTGRWYEPLCASHVPVDEARAYYASHPAVYIIPGERTPPPAEEGLDPEFLAEVAFEHMDLPVGRLRWNPSLDGSGATVVNLDTFVWIENTTTQVQVTASVPGVSSTVTATMTSLLLEADGADDATCDDAGTPYAPGMARSTCSIVFYRSSANLVPVKAGQTLPTATLTATATWEARWTSTLGAGGDLESQSIVTTAEIPVAEIQTIVTR